jgi:hypothetical protein
MTARTDLLTGHASPVAPATALARRPALRRRARRDLVRDVAGMAVAVSTVVLLALGLGTLDAGDARIVAPIGILACFAFLAALMWLALRRPTAAPQFPPTAEEIAEAAHLAQWREDVRAAQRAIRLDDPLAVAIEAERARERRERALLAAEGWAGEE